MLLYNFYIFRRAGYTLRHCIPWVDRPSSISGASLGLSGGRSSLRIPGIFSPDMSWSMGTSDTSLRSEMDNTFRLDRMESDRLIATRKKKRNLIAKKKTRWKKHLLVCDGVFVVCDCSMDDSYTPAPSTWINSWSSHSSQSHSCRMVEFTARNGGDGWGGRPFVAWTRSHIETLPVLTVFLASLLFRRESQKATIRVTEESRDLKEAHAGR